MSAVADRNGKDTGQETERLVKLVARLRGKDGCPWDREQTLETLKSYLIEEAYELLDAIENSDSDAHREELGDLLLQIILQSQIRAEQQQFTFREVVRQLCDKLIRRHPHVFGDIEVTDTSDVLQNWEAIKAGEKEGERRSVLEGVPRHLPALQKAQRIQSRAARVGFDWSKLSDVIAKVDEELQEIREAIDENNEDAVNEEIGDLLFAVVNLARFHKVDTEAALRNTNAKFTKRFQEIERRLHAGGRNMSESSLEEMDTLWEEIKNEEKAERRSA